MSDLYAALEAIQRCDPDGGEREPTDADYRAHEEWAIAAFGVDVWRKYRTPGWGEALGPDYYCAE